MLIAAIAVIACESETPVTPEVNILSDVSSLVVPTEGGQVSVDFDANVDWTVSLKESADWCTVTPASGVAGSSNVKFIAVENTGNENRTATVVITAETAVKEFTVTQLQKDALVLSGSKSFDVEADGGEVKFSVNHNVTLTATANVEWITATKAMQTTEYKFTVAANTGAARTGIITVTNGTLKEEITVNQAAWVPVFEVSPKEDQWIALEGGSVTVEVNANVEYNVTVGENDWLTQTKDGGKYTFTATENASYDYRSVAISVTPKDEAYAESAVSFNIFQNGRASKLWAKHPAKDFEGYNAAEKVRLAMYGEYLLVANGPKVFALNPTTGDVVSTFALPEGYSATNLVVDDAGNLLIAADAIGAGDLVLYYVADPANPAPVQVLSYSAANYYSVNTGNVRVKGNIKDDAVITAVASDGAGGACIAWEVVDGVVSDFAWTNPPYTAWDMAWLCFAPVGPSMADGFFYIGYGGDYNLQYTDNFVKGGGTTWAASYVTGSSWMENYNCISTAEWKGTKYAAVVAGCHFNYDATDVILLNVNNPASAEFVYKHLGDGDAEWDWSVGVNNSWTGLGTFSDVLLVPTENTLLMIYADTNYGAMACVEIK